MIDRWDDDANDDDWDDDADHAGGTGGADDGGTGGADDGGADDSDDGGAGLIPCPECGTPIDDDSPHCPACGHWLTAEEDPAPRRPLWVVVTALVCLGVAVALALLA
ncbi:MAG: zinc ribbon domain-containing protein [Pirellulales bacterium]